MCQQLRCLKLFPPLQPHTFLHIPWPLLSLLRLNFAFQPGKPLVGYKEGEAVITATDSFRNAYTANLGWNIWINYSTDIFYIYFIHDVLYSHPWKRQGCLFISVLFWSQKMALALCSAQCHWALLGKKYLGSALTIATGFWFHWDTLSYFYTDGFSLKNYFSSQVIIWKIMF